MFPKRTKKVIKYFQFQKNANLFSIPLNRNKKNNNISKKKEVINNF